MKHVVALLVFACAAYGQQAYPKVINLGKPPAQQTQATQQQPDQAQPAQAPAQPAQQKASATPPQPAQQPTLTLWGITMGAPAPAWPTCAEHDSSSNPPCVPKSLGPTAIGQDDKGEKVYQQYVYNVVPNETVSTVVSTIGGRVEMMEINFDEDDTCEQVVAAFTKKFGKPAHKTSTMQNGFGATWEANVFVWATDDKSELRLSQREEKRDEGCSIVALSGATIKSAKTREVAAP
jgi:hypothetical protein